MTDLSIHTDSTKDITVVDLMGRIDSDSAPDLDEAIEKLLQEHSKVVLNLQDVEYMSSAGLRAIVRAIRLQRRRMVMFI